MQNIQISVVGPEGMPVKPGNIASADPATNAVKIYVDYETPEEAQQCIKAMNGRYFAGKVVKASLI